ncbi:hypothetical protein QEH59_09660 [Coraliomargarita sp. SDUM461004]|uniref:Glycosyl hydrolases family 39 N-terminal catalytic domain-containing protein n=1 Tax=Thalassobacterium sedimentorum TaxID=3041258 RepID=A0ABU1AJ15_9BACT|nr:hypothetical protein [Coraliomargarita sp. SDUM461004]MDQ8194692.1 hypothetical protein [Coraliomargarita sp. SDUM461004]
MAKRLNHPWKSIITMGRAHDLLRHDVMQHLAYLQQEIGYRYCRFHALFHDDMAVVERMQDGRLHFHWHHIDKIFDALLSIGLKPFVELNSMPLAMASGAKTMFFYQMNVTPPKSYTEWEDLIEAFSRHCIDRYGIAEVRTWYFEVWNEPNLSNFWSSNRDEYFKLYSHAASGVKKADAQLRIGGPATAGGAWVSETIQYCADNNVPLDFVSTHSYPQDEQNLFEDGLSPHQPGEYFIDIVRSVQEAVASSAMPDLEIHWTEWNTQSALNKEAVSWSNNIYVDNAFAASFIVKHMLALDEACDSLGWWIASDIFEEYGYSQNPFSCNYGLLTNHGLPKASCNAFRLLARMTGELIESNQSSQYGEHRGACVTRDGDVLKALLWYHPPLVSVEQAETWAYDIQLPVESRDSVRYLVTSAWIRAHKGSFWETWCEVDRPNHLSPFEVQAFRDMAEPEMTVAQAIALDGQLQLAGALKPYEVKYFELRPQPPVSIGKGSDLTAWTELDAKLNESVR